MAKEVVHYAKITVINRWHDQLWDLLEAEAEKCCDKLTIEFIEVPKDVKVLKWDWEANQQERKNNE